MSKAFNISLPESYSKLITEMSKLTGESMASIIQRAVIAYIENAIATGLIDKLRDESAIDESAE
jgi:predicted DNA-binding protein